MSRRPLLLPYLSWMPLAKQATSRAAHRLWRLVSIVSAVGLIFIVIARWVGCDAPYYEPYGLSLDIDSDGRQAVVSTADGHLFLVNLHTGERKPLTPDLSTAHSGAEGMGSGRLSYPAFSPGGRRVAFTAASDLWLCSRNGASVLRVTQDATYAEMAPDFSPDGSRLVFIRARNNQFSPSGVWWVDYDVWTVRTDGTDLRQLTDCAYQSAGRPHFTPDGHTVIFEGKEGDGMGRVRRAGIWSVGADLPVGASGYAAPRLVVPAAWVNTTQTDNLPYIDAPDLSPDGSKVAFISDAHEPYMYDLCTAPLPRMQSSASPKPHRLGRTKPSQEKTWPTFAPNGRTLYYFVSTGQLWAVHVDGTDAHPVPRLKPL
jgi:Tol biopolymer transport system component